MWTTLCCQDLQAKPLLDKCTIGAKNYLVLVCIVKWKLLEKLAHLAVLCSSKKGLHSTHFRYEVWDLKYETLLQWSSRFFFGNYHVPVMDSRNKLSKNSQQGWTVFYYTLIACAFYHSLGDLTKVFKNGEDFFKEMKRFVSVLSTFLLITKSFLLFCFDKIRLLITHCWN